jgi:hypothetical protein
LERLMDNDQEHMHTQPSQPTSDSCPNQNGATSNNYM